jgi:hypothetical protein
MAVALSQAGFDTFDPANATPSRAAIAIGSAAADRLVFAAITYVAPSTGNDINSLTIGGVAATRVRRDQITDTTVGVFNCSEIWWAAVPTGTTATFAYNIDAGLVGGTFRCVTYAVTGADTTTPVSSSTTASLSSALTNAVSNTLTVVADGAALGHAWGVMADTITVAWTFLTENFDNDYENNGVGLFIGQSTASRAGSATAQAITATFSATGSFSLFRGLTTVAIQPASGEEIEGDGSASVTTTVTGTSAALKEAAGSASASAAASATGIATASAAGSASVQTTAVATSAAEKEAAGSVAVSSTVAGISAALKETTASASAATTAAASSRALKEAAGSASVSVTAEAVGESEASGDAIGTASVATIATGVSAALAQAAGLATVITSASAIGIGFIPGAERIGGASYLTQEEYDAAQARYRKLANARKDIKRRERERWNRILGREQTQEDAPEPDIAPLAAKAHKPLVIAPIPTVAAPSAKLEAIAAEMQRLRDKIAAHQAALDEEDEIETLLMLVA